MPIPVFTSGVAAATVFHLLGADEVDMTQALGWSLGVCDTMRQRILIRVLGEDLTPRDVGRVDLQRSLAGEGRTDIELRGPTVGVVIEAKKGMSVPTEAQLLGYARRLHGAGRTAIVSLSDLPADVAASALPASVSGTPVVHLTWRDIVRMAAEAKPRSDLAARRVLDDLVTFLEGVIVSQRISSNATWVFALSRQPFAPSAPSSVEMVERQRIYTHPLGPRWPKTPPNYVGFRYDGHLQSIHHVESWRIINDIHEAVDGFPESVVTGLFLAYALGAPIRPTTKVRSGLPRDTRARAHIDLLLTSATVREAAERTRAREAAELPVRPHAPAPPEPVHARRLAGSVKAIGCAFRRGGASGHRAPAACQTSRAARTRRLMRS